MSLKDDYYAEKRESDRELDASWSLDASESILLTEYGALLRTIEPVRIVNRTLLIGLTLLQILFGPSLLSRQVLLGAVVVLACAFWFLQEYVIGRKLGRLGELIAATNADAVGTALRRPVRPVVVPPPKKGSQTGETAAPSANVEAQNQDLEKISIAQSWTNSYVSWRQESWKTRKFLMLQRAEPIIWFFLTLTFEIYRLGATR